MFDRIIPILEISWPFGVFVGMLLVFFVLLRIWTRPKKLPYLARERLVTKTELKFFRALRKAVRDDWEIFAMVRMADLLRVQKKIKNRKSWINKILAKHIDFVICDPNTLEPLLCIELDDGSHARPDRVERDKFVDQVFDSAGLPLIRFPVSEHYPTAELRNAVREIL
ncbi:MAG: DUF2726 domain-containing protein [Mariniblastus sp.]|nr:DUF2726 domain-containing protein [Mariniblastus sp.]